MGHDNKKKFAAKHKGKKINKTIASKIRSVSNDHYLTCSLAHTIAKTLDTDIIEIGVQTDLLEYKITECQLGLFGYGNGKKRLNPDIDILPELNEQLDKATRDNQDERISCLECWEIAKLLKIKKLDAASACEKKNIRIKPCQLGAF